MEAGQPGQEELERFIRRVRLPVEKYVAKRVRNRDHGDEVVSRVFEALARTWGSFRGDCPGEAYAILIAANALKNYYSRDLQKISKQISLDVWVETYTLQHDPSLVCPYERLESAEWVKSLLEEMGRCCTELEGAVINMFYQGQSFEEVSTLLGLNAATVRGHFLRGRKKLLVHLLVNQPELLGGMESFLATVAQTEANNPGLLTSEERRALESRSGTAELLRGAMAKIGPYLGAIR